MSTEKDQLQAGIAAVEAQRALLGNTAVDAAVAGLRAKLVALEAPAAAEPAPTLRQVSVLFLDMVGSTSLGQGHDPEAVGALMDGVLARGTAIVLAHGGKVLQYAGDSLLAAFGAKTSSEDDTERAVRCGLALLTLGKTVEAEAGAPRSDAGFDVRVGIHTGHVLLGGGVNGEGSIRGQAVNIAARMEQTAPVGGLRITHDTYVQVRGLFEVGPADVTTVKGVNDPVASRVVFRAKPRSFRIVLRGLEGVDTKMIGRDAELEALRAAFGRLFAERRLVAVTVVGEAGLGKSRLLGEFEAWSEERPERYFLFRGRATPQTRSQPYGLLRDIVAWRMQLRDGDTLGEAKAKIEAGLLPIFHDEPEVAQAHVHLLGHLIGVDWKDSPHLRGILDDPRQIRNRGLHAAAHMFRRFSIGGGQPVVLHIEDLHWADDESLDFLDHLSEVDRDVPLLILATTRPTLFERRTGWHGTGGRHERIDLHPLDRTGSRMLAGELLKKLPEATVALGDMIIGGAEGNPFYMEELVRMLIDQGAIDRSGEHWRLDAERLLATQVPATLTGVLQARLDGLPAQERLTLQAASVIGQVFWDRALIALDAASEIALPSLVRRGLTLQRHDAAIEVADGLREYAFQHAILHQVTYGTLLRTQRRELHARVATWLAAQSQTRSARAGDFLGLTAHHYAEAGDDANAAEFHARAAEHANGRLAHAAVLAQVGRSLALLDRAGERPTQASLRWRLHKAREETLELQGERERQAADLDAMDSIADALDDDARRAYATYRRAYLAMRLADWPACEAGARRAATLADAALADVDAGPAGAGVDALRELRLLCLRLQGQAMARRGAIAHGEALLQRTLDEAGARGLTRVQAACLNSLARLAHMQNDPLSALRLDREALALVRQQGDRRNEAISLGNIGASWTDLGDLVEARRHLDESLQLHRQHGDRAQQCIPLLDLSAAALREGDGAGALEHARCALDIAVSVRAPDLEASAATTLGNAEAALGRWSQAVSAYERARRVALEVGRGVRFDAAAGLAALALAQGDVAGALREVQTLLTDTGEFVDSARPRWIGLTLHRVLAAAGDPRAEAWLRRVHDSLQAQAGNIGDAQLRHLFLTAIPHHRDIVALWAGRQPEA